MSILYINQLKEIQDKTSLKGIYLFLTLTITSYFFIAFKILTFTQLINPLDYLPQYFNLIVIVSLSSAFLYYVKPENYIVKKYMWLKGRVINYLSYRNVSYSEGFNHLFLTSEKNRVLSKLLFFVSLMFITFLFWNLMSIILFFIFIISIVIINFFSFKINLSFIMGKLGFMKLFYKALNAILRNIGMILLLILIAIMNFWNALISINFFLIFVLLGLVILIFSFTNDWNKLEVKLKLIFFMELFLQDDKLNKTELIEKFVQNIKENLWFDAKLNFQIFINQYLSPLIWSTTTQSYNAIMYLNRMFEKTIQIFTQGYPSSINPEDSNKLNIYYTKNVFNYFDKIINNSESFDSWIYEIFCQGKFPKLPNEFNDYYNMIKSDFFDKSSQYENLSFFEYCLEITKNHHIEESFNRINLVENIYYYFIGIWNSVKMMEEAIKKLEEELNLKKIDEYLKKREARWIKIKTQIDKYTSKISPQLNSLKINGLLELYITKNLSKDEFEKIVTIYEDYKIAVIPDFIFIEKGILILGKSFRKIFKGNNIRNFIAKRKDKKE